VFGPSALGGLHSGGFLHWRASRVNRMPSKGVEQWSSPSALAQRAESSRGKKPPAPVDQRECIFSPTIWERCRGTQLIGYSRQIANQGFSCDGTWVTGPYNNVHELDVCSIFYFTIGKQKIIYTKKPGKAGAEDGLVKFAPQPALRPYLVAVCTVFVRSWILLTRSGAFRFYSIR